MKIYQENVNKYNSNQHLIGGIAKDNIGDIYIEYYSGKYRKENLIKISYIGSGMVVEHICLAAEKGVPCWHLGAAAAITGAALPIVIETITKEPKIPKDFLVDITNKHLDKKGSFVLLNVKENEEPEENKDPGNIISQEPKLSNEDLWLKKYSLPSKLLQKLLFFRDKQKQTLTTEQISRIPAAEYIPTGREVIYSIASLLYGNNGEAWEAPLLIGPKGSGKSTLAETLSAMLMLPVNKIFGGIDINAEALLGSKTLIPTEGIDIITEAKLRAACKQTDIDPEHLVHRLRNAQLKVGFEPGLLLKAVQSGEMLIIDEVNMVIPEVTSLLHGLLDWQKVLSIPGNGTTNVPPNFRLVSCMNYGYAGSRSLNEAFQDRFRSVQVPHLPEEKLAGLIILKTNCSESTAEKLSELFRCLSDRVQNGDLSDRILSIRGLLRIAREEMDTTEELRKVAISVITESLNDKFEIDQVADIIEACL